MLGTAWVAPMQGALVADVIAKLAKADLPVEQLGVTAQQAACWRSSLRLTAFDAQRYDLDRLAEDLRVHFGVGA